MHASDALAEALDAFESSKDALLIATGVAKRFLQKTYRTILEPHEYESNNSIVEMYHNKWMRESLGRLDYRYKAFLVHHAKLTFHMAQASKLIQSKDPTVIGVHSKECVNIYDTLEKALLMARTNFYGFRILGENEDAKEFPLKLDMLPFLNERWKQLSQYENERAELKKKESVEKLETEQRPKYKRRPAENLASVLRAVERNFVGSFDYTTYQDEAVTHSNAVSPSNAVSHSNEQLSTSAKTSTSRLRLLEDRLVTVRAVKIIGVEEAESVLVAEIYEEYRKLDDEKTSINSNVVTSVPNEVKMASNESTTSKDEGNQSSDDQAEEKGETQIRYLEKMKELHTQRNKKRKNKMGKNKKGKTKKKDVEVVQAGSVDPKTVGISHLNEAETVKPQSAELVYPSDEDETDYIEEECMTDKTKIVNYMYKREHILDGERTPTNDFSQTKREKQAVRENGDSQEATAPQDKVLADSKIDTDRPEMADEIDESSKGNTFLRDWKDEKTTKPERYSSKDYLKMIDDTIIKEVCGMVALNMRDEDMMDKASSLDCSDEIIDKGTTRNLAVFDRLTKLCKMREKEKSSPAPR